MTLSTHDISAEELFDNRFTIKGVSVSVLRLDKIHPVISGNKLFKLKFYLDELESGRDTLISFGGAYSNHLAATAYVGKMIKVKTIGVVRGEKPANLSPTLLQCETDDMQLIYVSREEYATINIDQVLKEWSLEKDKCVIVPEGGYGVKGCMGAAEIMQHIDSSYSHIVTPVGTATTFSGLIKGSNDQQKIIGIPVLKGMIDIPYRLQHLLGNVTNVNKWEIIPDYHFGGYAKKTDELIKFMNEFWDRFRLPLDFVYTAKMFFGVIDLINKDHFPPRSKIMVIHTGGLQGNRSLAAGILHYA